MSNSIINISIEEINQQKIYAQQVKVIEKVHSSYHVVTYGCQMNEHDSQKISGMLENMGFTMAEDRTKADIVIFNTCCIRENANRRALGNIIWLKETKKKRPHMLIGVCGCMMEQKGMAEKVLKQYPFIDFALGTGNLYKLPEILYNVIAGDIRCIRVSEKQSTLVEGLPVVRLAKEKAYISIMQGCNNYCSYCIVPYVRGRERSRKSADILKEAEALLKDGVKEIMLLGQNVNSYGKGTGDMTFPKLLRSLDELGVPRIRFMTSHPKDLSPELIEEYAKSRGLCGHLHLPVQSGSDRVLELMNRGYDRESYIDKVKALRKAVPQIGITSDIIVAFPTETDEDFEQTLQLVKEIRYDSAFTFVYSPRAGTSAYNMKGKIPKEIATERIERLIAIQENITKEVLKEQLGKTCNVLVEGVSRRDETMLTGKNERNISVNFTAESKNLLGEIVKVKITDFGSNTLRGIGVEK
ncbi:MAG: tRNA (N6-isopentenyl adenosine(37)-C2)-methylthiotransferase MiaB [Christensenellales bacterium]|jgi:tRNA-2-methylthio-N6-dimethylallyladenosine synthase|nr:tRNA (N6-isopentenyl adenosine(37)-C2)-methylthiotransferase MiaB [Christensenellaceae bacterium]